MSLYINIGKITTLRVVKHVLFWGIIHFLIYLPFYILACRSHLNLNRASVNLLLDTLPSFFCMVIFCYLSIYHLFPKVLYAPSFIKHFMVQLFALFLFIFLDLSLAHVFDVYEEIVTIAHQRYDESVAIIAQNDSSQYLIDTNKNQRDFLIRLYNSELSIVLPRKILQYGLVMIAISLFKHPLRPSEKLFTHGKKRYHIFIRAAAYFVSLLKQKRVLLHLLFWVIMGLLFWLLVALPIQHELELEKSHECIAYHIGALFVYLGLVGGCYLNNNYLMQKFLFRKTPEVYIGKVFQTFIYGYIGAFAIGLIIMLPLLFFLPEYYNQITGFLREVTPDNWIPVFSFFLIMLIIAAMLKMVRKIYWEQRMRETSERERLKTELKFLKAQLNPHFLFNTLNNIYSLAIQNSEKVPGVIFQFSELLKYLLRNSNVNDENNDVLLSREIKFIRSYLELESLRFGNNTNVHFDVKGRITDQKILPLVFINFIENGIKHGVNKLRDKGYIKIHLEVEDTDLFFNVENNYIQNEDKVSLGIGIENVKKRLKLKYPDKHTLKIISNHEIYRVELYINLEI